MCSTINMDQQQQYVQSTSGAEVQGGDVVVGSASELPSDISQMDFQTIKAASDTLKNSKLQFSQSDLLKLLSYLEGELQARDVVIAALKSEKLKNIINIKRHKQLGLNDPQAALFRDALAVNGNYVSRQSSTAAAQSENEIQQFAGHQLDMLEETIRHQRNTHFKLVSMMRDTEHKQKGLIRELEEEKRKHERDTAQGDDITYGLEIERTQLRQELETEKVARRKCEKDLKKAQETLEQERARQKQIVLLLLAERKKIITKYVEERKRSEDLAQILSEEKQRVDTMADGLEEESKKSLRMEAELEKQLQTFNGEIKLLNAALAKEEKRIKEQECEIAQLKAENDMIRKQALPHRLGPKNVPIPLVPAKIGTIRCNSVGGIPSIDGAYTQDENQATIMGGGGNTASTAASPMISSVAKVVQPTATVSSVPVSGPTTGIARSIPTGQSLRQQPQYQSTINSSNANDVGHSHVYNKGSNASNVAAVIDQQQTSQPPPTPTPSSSSLSSSQSPSSIPTTNNSSTVVKKKAMASTTAAGPSTQSQQQFGTVASANNAVRGVPPPIPPNKPIIPPKRESLNSNKNNNSTPTPSANNQTVKNTPNKDGIINLSSSANKTNNETSNLTLDISQN